MNFPAFIIICKRKIPRTRSAVIQRNTAAVDENVSLQTQLVVNLVLV